MIWIIVLGSVGLLGGLFMAAEAATDGVEMAMLSLLFGMFGVMCAAPFVAAAEGIAYPFTGTAYDTHRNNLEVIADSPGVSGQFFLGIGGVATQLTVSYYQATDYGYSQPRSVTADGGTDVRIYEDSPTPYVIKRFPHSAHEWVGSLFNGTNTKGVYEFHVPAGTIKRDYTLDAK